MNARTKTVALLTAVLAAGAVAVACLALGFRLGQHSARETGAATGAAVAAPAGLPKAEGKALYWYDPMSPEQHFDKPGRSPFMDMPLVPRYATSGADASAVAIAIDPGITQNLGMRVVKVQRASLQTSIVAPAVVQFNDRDVAQVQARASGFVQRVYARAPGDVVASGAPLADLLVPDWAGAQEEFLAVVRTGDAALAAAARRRLLLLGMPEAMIERVADSGRTEAEFTIVAPIAGVIQELGVRSGMTLSQGMAIARINGLATVWLEAAVAEAQSGPLRVGQAARVSVPAWPGRAFAGKVIAVLPQLDSASRSVRVRIELPNPAGQLKPGMFAQVELATGTQQPVLWVPSEAVIRTGTRDLVVVSDGPGRFKPVRVTLGQESGGRTAVLSGLSEGDSVVASGQFLLDSEATLRGVFDTAPADPPVEIRKTQPAGSS